MFAKFESYRIADDGSIERSSSQLPAVAVAPGVRVSMPAGTDPKTAARLLRRLADDLEAQPQ